MALVDLTGNADDVIRPITLPARGQSLQLNGRLVSIASEGDASVSPQAKRNANMPIDRGRQHEALVVVRVLADNVDSPGSDRDGARRIAKCLAKAATGAFIELVWRAHD